MIMSGLYLFIDNQCNPLKSVICYHTYSNELSENGLGVKTVNHQTSAQVLVLVVNKP